MENNSWEGGEQASLTRTTVHGVLWVTATRALKVPLNLLAVAVLARLLSPSDFGIVAIGLLIKTLSDVLVDGSFGMVLIQRRELRPAVIGASLALSMALAALFAAAVVLLAPTIEVQFDFPELGQVLTAISAILPITAITAITSALLQRSFQFPTLAINTFASQLAYAATAIGLAVSGFGLWSLVFGLIVSASVDALMGFLAVRKQYRVNLSLQAVREVLGSGWMFTFSRLLGWAATSVDRLVIARFLGAADLGYYTRSAALMTAARQLTGAEPARVLFSAFAKIQGDKPRIRKGYLRSLSLTLVLSALVSAFVLVNAEIIVRILLGPNWLPAVPLMQVLFVGYIARSGYVVAESVPLALGLGGASALRQAAQLILVFAGAAIGAQFGVIGAAIGVTIGRWIFYLLCLFLVHRLLRVDWLGVFRVHAESVLIALVPVLFALVARWLLPGDGLLVQLVPAAVFGFAASILLIFAPASVLGEDLVRGRMHLWEWLSASLPRLRTGG